MATDDKPWGDDFDESKAWTLIQNLRTDKTTLQTDNAQLKTDLATAEKTAQDAETAKTQAEEASTKAIADAEKVASDAKRELIVERVKAKFELDDDLAEFLTGDDEAEITAKAERLAKVGHQSNDIDENGRPKPDLKPGHGGDQPESVDVDAIVAEVRNTPR